MHDPGLYVKGFTVIISIVSRIKIYMVLDVYYNFVKTALKLVSKAFEKYLLNPR
jgi:hypothetical protein